MERVPLPPLRRPPETGLGTLSVPETFVGSVWWLGGEGRGFCKQVLCKTHFRRRDATCSACSSADPGQAQTYFRRRDATCCACRSAACSSRPRDDVIGRSGLLPTSSYDCQTLRGLATQLFQLGATLPIVAVVILASGVRENEGNDSKR